MSLWAPSSCSRISMFSKTEPRSTCDESSMLLPSCRPMTRTLSAYSSNFARLVLNCIGREYPNKLDHCIEDASQVQSPRSLHPAFYGCFDWHSAVHGHWMLVHLLRSSAPMEKAQEIHAALDHNLTQENLLAEVAYF